MSAGQQKVTMLEKVLRGAGREISRFAKEFPRIFAQEFIGRAIFLCIFLLVIYFVFRA